MQVQTWLSEEESRVANNLPQSTAVLLKKKLEEVLISKRFDIFHTEFIVLLEQEKVEGERRWNYLLPIYKFLLNS